MACADMCVLHKLCMDFKNKLEYEGKRYNRSHPLYMYFGNVQTDSFREVF